MWKRSSDSSESEGKIRTFLELCSKPTPKSTESPKIDSLLELFTQSERKFLLEERENKFKRSKLLHIKKDKVASIEEGVVPSCFCRGQKKQSEFDLFDTEHLGLTKRGDVSFNYPSTSSYRKKKNDTSLISILSSRTEVNIIRVRPGKPKTETTKKCLCISENNNLGSAEGETHSTKQLDVPSSSSSSSVPSLVNNKAVEELILNSPKQLPPASSSSSSSIDYPVSILKKVSSKEMDETNYENRDDQEEIKSLHFVSELEVPSGLCTDQKMKQDVSSLYLSTGPSESEKNEETSSYLTSTQCVNEEEIKKPKKKTSLLKRLFRFFRRSKKLPATDDQKTKPSPSCVSISHLLKKRKFLSSSLRQHRLNESKLYLRKEEYEQFDKYFTGQEIVKTTKPVLRKIPSSEILQPEYYNEESDHFEEEDEDDTESVSSYDSFVVSARKAVYDRLKRFSKYNYLIYLQDQKQIDHVSVFSLKEAIVCNDKPFIATYNIGPNDVRVRVTKDSFQPGTKGAVFTDQNWVACQNSDIKVSLIQGDRYLKQLDPTKVRIIDIDCYDRFSQIRICYQPRPRVKRCKELQMAEGYKEEEKVDASESSEETINIY